MRRILALVLLLFTLGTLLLVAAEPNGVQIVSNTTETPTPQSAASLATTGGSFTTLVLNATTQTLRWKAYVGNVTGQLVLADGANFSIYDWQLSAIAGEVYASRNSSVDWDSIQCAQNSTITVEQSQLNITTTADDSINRTFNNTVHTSFYVGTTYMPASNCRAIATYVNSTRQTLDENADFQEILLDDTQSLVYAGLLEDATQGYNNQNWDFQIIVAENPTVSQASTYYFWAELT